MSASPVDDYLDGLPPPQKAAFQHVRDVVVGAAHGVEEGTSYGMPAFLYAGRPLLGFRAAKQHLSVIALVHTENVASRRVAEHIGMRVERTALLDGDYPAVVYAAEPAVRPDVPRAPR